MSLIKNKCLMCFLKDYKSRTNQLNTNIQMKHMAVRAFIGPSFLLYKGCLHSVINRLGVHMVKSTMARLDVWGRAQVCALAAAGFKATDIAKRVTKTDGTRPLKRAVNSTIRKQQRDPSHTCKMFKNQCFSL